MFNGRHIPLSYLLDTSVATEGLINKVFSEIQVANLMEMNVRSMMNYGIDGLLSNAECHTQGIDNLIDVLVDDTMDGLNATSSGYRIELLDNDAERVAVLAYEIFTNAAEKLVNSGLLKIASDHAKFFEGDDAQHQLFMVTPLVKYPMLSYVTTNKKALIYAEECMRGRD